MNTKQGAEQDAQETIERGLIAFSVIPESGVDTSEVLRSLNSVCPGNYVVMEKTSRVLAVKPGYIIGETPLSRFEQTFGRIVHAPNGLSSNARIREYRPLEVIDGLCSKPNIFGAEVHSTLDQYLRK